MNFVNAPTVKGVLIVVILAIAGLFAWTMFTNPDGVLPGVVDEEIQGSEVTLVFEPGDRFLWLTAYPETELTAKKLVAIIPGTQTITGRDEFQDFARDAYDEYSGKGADFVVEPGVVYELSGITNNIEYTFKITGSNPELSKYESFKENQGRFWRAAGTFLKSMPVQVWDAVKDVPAAVKSLFVVTDAETGESSQGPVAVFFEKVKANWAMLLGIALIAFLGPWFGLSLDWLSYILAAMFAISGFYGLAAISVLVGLILYRRDRIGRLGGEYGAEGIIGGIEFFIGKHPKVWQAILVMAVGYGAAILTLGRINPDWGAFIVFVASIFSIAILRKASKKGLERFKPNYALQREEAKFKESEDEYNAELVKGDAYGPPPEPSTKLMAMRARHNKAKANLTFEFLIATGFMLAFMIGSSIYLGVQGQRTWAVVFALYAGVMLTSFLFGATIRAFKNEFIYRKSGGQIHAKNTLYVQGKEVRNIFREVFLAFSHIPYPQPGANDYEKKVVAVKARRNRQTWFRFLLVSFIGLVWLATVAFALGDIIGGAALVFLMLLIVTALVVAMKNTSKTASFQATVKESA